MSQAIIRSTLMTALSTWAAAHNPVLTIAREGQSFTKPPDGSVFLEPFLNPADTNIADITGSRKRYMGSFQINIWTKDTIGAGLSESIAEEIAQLFPVFPKTLDPVSIESPASIKRPLLDAGWRILPVVMYYRFESET